MEKNFKISDDIKLTFDNVEDILMWATEVSRQKKRGGALMFPNKLVNAYKDHKEKLCDR